MKKIFVPIENVFEEFILIKGSDVHHLRDVLRKKIGDKIDVCSGGFSFNCKIVEIKNNLIKLNILNKTSVQENNNIRLRLFQAIPKGKVIEEIIKKTSELGVFEFVPLITERCNVRYNSDESVKKLKRWQKLINETSKKVGIYPQMKITHPVDISEIRNHIKNNEAKIIFWESEENNSLKSALSKINKKITLNIIIGPEGGFSQREVVMLKETGFESVSLGKRIYTVETATIVAVSNILFYFEE